MLPLVLLLVLGVVEVGFALLDQQVVTKLTREGSNLISRDTVSRRMRRPRMQTMASRPVNFANGSRMIFSVLQEGRDDRDGQLQQDHPVPALRVRELHGLEQADHAGGGSFSGAPDYEAVNSDTNTGLQVTNVPANLVAVPGGYDLRHRDLHAAHADHAVRPASASRCRRSSIRSPTFSAGGCARFPQR